VNAVLLFRHESIIPAADKRKRRLLQLHVNRSQIQANLESTTARIAILPENQDWIRLSHTDMDACHWWRREPEYGM